MLAQALDKCLRAERRRPGSSEEVLAHVPRSARAELRSILALALQLSAAREMAAPSAEFRSAARARLLERIAPQSYQDQPAVRALAPARAGHRGVRRRWLLRSAVGLVAAVLAAVGAVSASASALPGDPLYGVKRAHEDLELRLAVDDQARVQSLLAQADTRLDETSRLLAAGRAAEASITAQEYAQMIERATATYVIALQSSGATQSSFASIQSQLDQEQQQLEAMLKSAPAGVRPDLRQALTTTERGQQLVADPGPVERALGGPPPPPMAVQAVATAEAAVAQPTAPATSSAYPAASAITTLTPAPAAQPTPSVTATADEAQRSTPQPQQTLAVVSETPSIRGDQLPEATPTAAAGTPSTARDQSTPGAATTASPAATAAPTATASASSANGATSAATTASPTAAAPTATVAQPVASAQAEATSGSRGDNRTGRTGNPATPGPTATAGPAPTQVAPQDSGQNAVSARPTATHATTTAIATAPVTTPAAAGQGASTPVPTPTPTKAGATGGAESGSGGGKSTDAGQAQHGGDDEGDGGKSQRVSH